MGEGDKLSELLFMMEKMEEKGGGELKLNSHVSKLSYFILRFRRAFIDAGIRVRAWAWQFILNIHSF